MPIITSHPQPTTYDIETARKEGVSEQEIFNHLTSTVGAEIGYNHQAALNDKVPIEEINNYLSKQPYRGTIINSSDINKGGDFLIDAARPVIAGAGAASVTTAAAPLGPGAPVAGALSYMGLDALMQHLKSQQPRGVLATLTGSPQGSFPAISLNTLEQYGLGSLIGKIGTKIKGALQPQIEKGLEELKPTFAQYANHPVAKWVQEVFANGRNALANQESQQLAGQKIEQAAQKISGKSNVTPENLARRIQLKGEGSLGELDNAIANNNDTVLSVGKLNRTTIPTSGVYPLSLTPFGPGNSVLREVEGPIQVNNLANNMQDFLVNKQKNLGSDINLSDQDQKLVRQAQAVLLNTESHFDPGGGLVLSTPISFEDANSLHDAFNKLAQKKSSEVSPIKDQFRQWADSLRDDIQGSIKSWKDPGGAAAAAFKERLGQQSLRDTVMQGGSFRDLVDNANSPVKNINAILDDPQKLERALKATNIQGLPTTNTRQDLAGYQLMRMFGDADAGNGNIDGSKLYNSWNSMSPDVKKLFGSRGAQDQLGQLLKNVAAVTQKGQSGANYSRIRLATRGVVIGGSMLHSFLSGNPMVGLGEVGTLAGLELPFVAAARMMTNPNIARAMQGAIQGTPLNMSEESLGRLLSGALNGFAIRLVDGNGEKHDAVIRNGKIEAQ